MLTPTEILALSDYHKFPLVDYCEGYQRYPLEGISIEEAADQAHNYKNPTTIRLALAREHQLALDLVGCIDAPLD